MTDDHASDDASARADALIRELRAFTESEAADLDALAAELSAIRSAFGTPAFDRDAIWDRIGDRLGRREPPPGDAGA
jgi:hypothetical protein